MTTQTAAYGCFGRFGTYFVHNMHLVHGWCLDGTWMVRGWNVAGTWIRPQIGQEGSHENHSNPWRGFNQCSAAGHLDHIGHVGLGLRVYVKANVTHFEFRSQLEGSHCLQASGSFRGLP